MFVGAGSSIWEAWVFVLFPGLIGRGDAAFWITHTRSAEMEIAGGRALGCAATHGLQNLTRQKLQKKTAAISSRGAPYLGAQSYLIIANWSGEALEGVRISAKR